MKKLFILFCISFLFIQLKAQVTVNYSLGYGTFKMDDMVDLQKSILKDNSISRLGIKTLDAFPSNYVHSINIGYRFDYKHEIGLKSSYYTTGGKLSKADYSAEYEMNFILNGYREGLYYRNYFFNKMKNNHRPLFSLFGEISPSILFSEVKQKEIFVVNEGISNEDKVVLIDINEKYNNISLAFLLQIGFKYIVTSHIETEVTFGYDLAPGSRIVELQDEPKTDWSGTRMNLGISYVF